MRIFCELRSIFSSPAGARKNKSNEENVRSYILYANHRIRGLLFPYKKNCYLSVKMTLTINKMFAGIICQTIEREVDYSTAKKELLFWLLFSIVNLFSIVKIWIIPRFVQFSHNCSFIRRYSPCCKPVKLGHYSVSRPSILRLFLTLYGKMTTLKGMLS